MTPACLRCVLLSGLLALLGGAEGDDAAAEAELQELLRQVMAERMAAPQDPEGQPRRPLAKPGRAMPVAPCAAQAWEIDWDNYRTLIVVEPGAQTRRRAWVATRKENGGQLAVAYTGTAFRDANGEIHIDCQFARIAGPMAGSWSPDSFAIDGDGRVRIIDDHDRGNPGRIVGWASPGGVDDRKLDYTTAHFLARWWVESAL